ncbi:MAG: hypothetical protein J6Y08_02290 [Clostridiales bacterium]|nr:hypothetical protein [Clostridiales bacterium]
MHINTSTTKRDWSPRGSIIAAVFGTIFLIMGIAAVVAAFFEDEKDVFSLIILGVFFILLGALLYGVAVAVSRYMKKKKETFISSFLSDEMTNVYKDKEAAAQELWVLVRKYLERSSSSEPGLEYSGKWLEKFKEQLGKYS